MRLDIQTVISCLTVGLLPALLIFILSYPVFAADNAIPEGPEHQAQILELPPPPPAELLEPTPATDALPPEGINIPIPTIPFGPNCPMNGMMPPQGYQPALVEAEPSYLDKLAEQPWRPAWGPVPALRGELAVMGRLMRLLRDPGATVRERAAFLLGQIGSPAACDALAPLLKDSDRGVRLQTGVALAVLGDARGLKACAAAVETSPTWLRYYAVAGLWTLNSPDSKAALSLFADDKDPLVGPAINAALETPYTPAPLPETNAPPRLLADEPLQDLWISAVNIMNEENDWWWHLGDYEQSIRCNEVMIFLDPRYIETYTVNAWLQWSLGRDAEAVRTLYRAVNVSPENPEAHFGLGFHYFNTKRYKLAVSPLRRAFELGGDVVAQRTYAHCLEKLGLLNESLSVWGQILEKDPFDQVSWNNRERVQQLIETTQAP